MSIRRIGRGCFMWPPLHAWAMGRWMQLLDRAEGPMPVANPEREDIQRQASAIVDALSALSIFELERPPAEYCHMRDGLARLVWRPCRPLTEHDVWHERGRCRYPACALAGALGRSSIQPERHWQLHVASVGDHAPDRAADRGRVLDTSAVTVVAGEGDAPYGHLVSATAAAPHSAAAPVHVALASAPLAAAHPADAAPPTAAHPATHVAAAASARLAAEGEPR